MKPLFVMPHYIATEELRRLAIDAMVSMKKADIFLLSIDDGSPLDAAFLADYSDKVIKMPENSGFAKAVNTGLRWALDNGYRYIGQANNDIEVYDGWLEALLEPFEKWGDTGITGIVHSQDREEAKRSKGRKITEGGLLNGRMQNGGLWLSSHAVLSDVGIFDERFEMGGEEDVDLFMRMAEKGYKLVMSDKSMFWHKEGATRWNTELDGFKDKNKAIEAKNYERYKEKWGYDIRERGIPFYEEVLEN